MSKCSNCGMDLFSIDNTYNLHELELCSHQCIERIEPWVDPNRCQRLGCCDTPDVVVVTWNGRKFKECFYHAAEGEKSGRQKLKKVL